MQHSRGKSHLGIAARHVHTTTAKDPHSCVDPERGKCCSSDAPMYSQMQNCRLFAAVKKDCLQSNKSC